jgi:hypothetical protein
MMIFIISLVFSGTKLYGQISVTATAGTTTGTYATLSAAFTAINAGTHQGVIDIAVTGNTTEPAATTALLASNGTTIIYSAISIKPSGGNWIINSAATPTANRGIIELQGADNVTIDGDDPLTAGTRNLTIQAATSANTGVTAVRLSSNSTTGLDGANNCTVKNLIIIGSRASGTVTVANYGINMSNYSTASMTTGAYSSLNTTIENNDISRCYIGIYANGASATYPNTGTIIRNNVIGSATLANNAGRLGIYVTYSASNATNGALIEGNDVRCGDVSPSGTGFSASISGIELGAGSQYSKVLRNNIHDVMQPSTSGWGAYGVNLSSATSANNSQIANNFINNIVASKYSTTALTAYVAYGIRFGVASTGHEVINNTIVIPATATGTTLNYVNYGVGFASGATVTKFYNNIVINNNNGTGTYAVYCAANTALSAAGVDNNNYYVPFGNIGYFNATNQATMTAWKTATTKDANSWNVMPTFVSTTDLHLPAGGAATLMENTGASVALTGISNDIDNQNRPGPTGSVNGGGMNPDIGADEFDGTPAPVPVITFISATPSLAAQCTTEAARLISMNITTPSGIITTATLNYSFNGVAQTPLTMTNTSGSVWEATIPAGVPGNATITWNVVTTNDALITTTFNGTSYQDLPLFGFTASVSTSAATVCEGTAAVLTAVLNGPSTATYSTPSIANPTTDEDLGNVLIKQGTTTILSNSSTGGSLVGTIGTATGTAGSYSNFTAFGPFNLLAGVTYTSQLTSITQGTTNFGNSMAIFIDYNRNGSFADPGEMVVAPGATTSGPHLENGTFTVPMSALNGNTRMRIACLETNITSAATTSGYGEYEDYTVNITNATVSWSDGIATVGTTNPITVNPTATTTYTATITTAGCPITATGTVSTIPLPAAPIATNSSQCGAQVPTASVASNAGASGTGSFYWYDAATAGTLLQTPPLAAYTTFYSNDFTNTTIGAGASLNGVANLTNVAGQLELTPNTGSQLGGITVDAGVNAQAYKVDFDFSAVQAGGADGLSYSFGDDVNAASTSPSAEMGSGTKLKVSFDAYGASMPNAAGIYLVYNNNAASYNSTATGVLGYVANASWVGTTNNHVTIETNNLGQVTVTLNGTALFTNVQLPAAYLSANKATWKHAIAARTGGVSMQQLLDNLVIQTAGFGPGSTTYGTTVPATTTLYVSETGTNGCVSQLTPVVVTVLTPAAITSAISSTLGCINDSITLTANSNATPAYTYTWTANTTSGSGIASPIAGDSIVVVPTTAGAYSYYVTGTNGTCTTIDTLTTTINSIIPFDPTVPVDYLNICNGATTGIINADALSNVAGSLATINTGGNGCTHGAMINVTSNGQPIVMKSADVRPNTTGAQNVLVYYKVGTYVGSETNAGAWTLVGTYPINGTTGVLTNVDFADFTIPANTTYGIYFDYNAGYSNLSSTYSNADITITTGSGFCTSFSGPITGRTFNGVLYYDKPIPTTITWFPTATGGSQVGTGSPFETVGTSVLPNTATDGPYEFWAAGYTNGCYSLNRALVTVNIAAVNAQLVAIDASCNGNNNGTFTLGTVDCGIAPFVYSVNGGTYGPIPTDLVAGTYSIIIEDANGGHSAPIVVTIGQPTAPQGLATTTVNYFTADVTWTPQGNETSWTVEWGPTGFTPGTGTTLVATTNSATLTGLNANSTYDFYVTADCGTNSAAGGPLTFATNPGFLAWDNSCGPGWTDISTTGTQIVGMTDDSESGLTLPWAWNINGTSVSSITIGNNGGVLFNTTTGNVGYTATGNGMFPYVQDLNTALAGGGVYYQNVGTAPNRQFIIQWNNIPHYSTGTDGASFEIIVDEATSDVYYIYNDVMMSNTAWNYGADAEIALISPNGSATISTNSATYLTNNSCIHFYNALCPNVTNFSAIVYADDAILDWNPGLYNETAWTLVYGLAGFDPTVPGQEIGTLNLTSSDASFGGTLTQLTGYDVYIYSECQADNLTSDGYFYNFTTLPYCSNPSGLTVATDVDSLEVTWNWLASSPTYAIQDFNIAYAMANVGANAYTGVEVATGNTNTFDTIADVNLLAGGVYQVYVQAVCTTGDTSSYVGPFTVIMPLTNDTVCGAEMLTLGTDYMFNNTGATVSVDETNIAPPATGAQTTTGWVNSTLNGTTWFTFVAPASGSVRVNSTANNYNGQSAVYEVGQCSDFNNNFNLLAANDDAIGGTQLSPNYTICGLTPGATYYLMHDGFNATTGNHAIRITEIVLEAGNANALAQICYGDNIDLFTTINGYDAAGTWSAPVNAVNASITGSTFNSTGLAYQTFNFQYRVTDGCAYDSIVSQVQIFAPSNAGQDGTLTVCKNEPVNLISGLNVQADLNGTWYDPSNVAMPSSQITASAFPGSFNYDYIVGNGVCPDDTANVVLNVLSSCDYLAIEEANFSGVQVYPNPTDGIVFIATDINAGNFSYEVTDANGRVITAAVNGITAAATSSIDLSKVEVGVYFIKLSNATADKVYRIVVQ